MQVLVVEDDPTVATSVERCLRTDGYEVSVVSNGGAALELLRGASFDVVVLDLLLPGVNGYRVCEALRAVGDWTPILMLTAKSGEYDEADALELGADDFLTKPFSSVVLRARVRALLRRPRHSEVPAERALRLDPLRGRCIWRDTGVVALSPRELELLAYLVDRAGEVVAKAELRESIWGADFRGDPNIVEVYVARLRRKLEQVADSRLIETIRGVGYRLSACALSGPQS